jgi:hypothetical protein
LIQADTILLKKVNRIVHFRQLYRSSHNAPAKPLHAVQIRTTVLAEKSVWRCFVLADVPDPRWLQQHAGKRGPRHDP